MNAPEEDMSAVELLESAVEKIESGLARLAKITERVANGEGVTPGT